MVRKMNIMVMPSLEKERVVCSTTVQVQVQVHVQVQSSPHPVCVPSITEQETRIQGQMNKEIHSRGNKDNETRCDERKAKHEDVRLPWSSY